MDDDDDEEEEEDKFWRRPRKKQEEEEEEVKPMEQEAKEPQPVQFQRKGLSLKERLNQRTRDQRPSPAPKTKEEASSSTPPKPVKKQPPETKKENVVKSDGDAMSEYERRLKEWKPKHGYDRPPRPPKRTSLASVAAGDVKSVLSARLNRRSRAPSPPRTPSPPPSPPGVIESSPCRSLEPAGEGGAADRTADLSLALSTASHNMTHDTSMISQVGKDFC